MQMNLFQAICSRCGKVHTIDWWADFSCCGKAVKAVRYTAMPIFEGRVHLTPEEALADCRAYPVPGYTCAYCRRFSISECLAKLCCEAYTRPDGGPQKKAKGCETCKSA
jgi:hypothetical protein